MERKEILGKKSIFENILTESFPKLKDMKTQIQESLQTQAG